MASASWSLDLPEERHRIDVDYGYWSGRATIRVDGRVATASGQLLRMGFDRGVDLPIDVEHREVVVSIRPTLVGGVIVTGYRFGLSVDGVAAAGTDPIPPMESARSGPRVVEAMAWASAGGGVIGLSQHGQNPTAILFLTAPVACSWVTRRTHLSTRLMAMTCLGIIIAVIIGVALIGAAIRR